MEPVELEKLFVIERAPQVEQIQRRRRPDGIAAWQALVEAARSGAAAEVALAPCDRRSRCDENPCLLEDLSSNEPFHVRQENPPSRHSIVANREVQGKKPLNSRQENVKSEILKCSSPPSPPSDHRRVLDGLDCDCGFSAARPQRQGRLGLNLITTTGSDIRQRSQPRKGGISCPGRAMVPVTVDLRESGIR
jgi:hypothetical protein